jgi:3D (Asp-Asp-Asp) domain-containing protein
MTVKTSAYKIIPTQLPFNILNNMLAIQERMCYNILVSRGEKRAYELFTITAYDLGYNSCGKTVDHPAYGITASGFSLKGMYWKTDKYIAVDPTVIPLGSLVEIIFQDEEHHEYSGIYKAVDTGSAIKDKKIDLFIGDFKQNKSSKEALYFGVSKALVRIIE